MKSGEFAVYKKMGAAQFRFAPPKLKPGTQYIERDGSILMDCAAGTGKEKDYNWNNKIVFSFGPADIIQLIDTPEKPPRLIHKLGEAVKSVEFVPATDPRYAGTFMLNVAVNGPDGSNTVRVPFTSGEWYAFTSMAKQMLPYMYGWLNSGLE